MLRDILAVLILAGGLFFFGVGVLGLFRFPDAMTRLHAVAKCDTLGTALVLLALILGRGLSLSGSKILLMLIFIWITNPVASHALARAAYLTMPIALTGDKIVDFTKGEREND